jgi:hypothetical protein
MRLVRRAVCAAVAAGIAIFGTAASAATLELQTQWVDDPTQLDTCGNYDHSPTGCWGWYEHYIVYAGGAELNNVTVTGEGAEAIVLRDPNVPIAGGGSDGDVVIVDPLAYPDFIQQSSLPVERSWNCVSPQQRGHALCFGTPSDAGLASFDKLSILLGGGDDALNLTYASMAATVTLGSGDDLVHARNGRVDHIECGAGNDGVWADSGDTVDSTCEAVTR